MIVVPSEDLVVARLGASHGPGCDIEGMGTLVRDVVAALHVTEPPADARPQDGR